MGLERRDRVVQPSSRANRSREERVNEAKPFDIPKREVWEAFKKVRANQGAAGVDGQTVEAFEADLASSLYKLWNRMSSGSYHPAPVRRVMIPKAGGGERPLGIPTVSDRVAQQVVKQRLERVLEPFFHDDSYGYRPGRSAIDAVRKARQRCWRSNWVLDIDIKSFFDTIDWGLLLKAVRKHTDCQWMLLYIERWLKAPVQIEDGSVVAREAGTPQGGVISPLLANLFLHYAFDAWMARAFPYIPFERYADDIICHCRSEAEAQALRNALNARLSACKLTLHPQKTKIVYCNDWNRRGAYPVISFDFLGYNFRPRKSIWQGKLHVHSFLPAISPKAVKAIGRAIRGWRLHHWTQMSLEDLAARYNAHIRGWIGYFGHFYGGRLSQVLRRIDVYLIRWARRKYRRLMRRPRGARYWLAQVRRADPTLFAHWRFVAEGGRTSGAV